VDSPRAATRPELTPVKLTLRFDTQATAPSVLLADDEGKQISIEPILMGGGEAVRRA
jgi:hypothetical protein